MLRTPLLFVLGFIVIFVLGGVTGIMFAVIPFDQQMTDSYFVVAHFHYVLFGGAVFPLFGGVYYWFPKVTGRLCTSGSGKWQLLAPLRRVQPHVLPDARRRAARHAAARLHLPGRARAGTRYNLLATVGAFVLAAGVLLVVVEPRARARARAAPARRRSVGRRHARVGDDLAAAGVQLPGHPGVRSAHPNWDRAERVDAQRRLERGELSLDAGTADAGDDGARRRPRRGARDAGRVAVAARARALARGPLRDGR